MDCETQHKYGAFLARQTANWEAGVFISEPASLLAGSTFIFFKVELSKYLSDQITFSVHWWSGGTQPTHALGACFGSLAFPECCACLAGHTGMEPGAQPWSLAARGHSPLRGGGSGVGGRGQTIMTGRGLCRETLAGQVRGMRTSRVTSLDIESLRWTLKDGVEDEQAKRVEKGILGKRNSVS